MSNWVRGTVAVTGTQKNVMAFTKRLKGPSCGRCFHCGTESRIDSYFDPLGQACKARGHVGFALPIIKENVITLTV